MSISLNNSQVKHISNLINMKGVSHYDINMEMTDHIASEVECLMAEENLNYQEAVKKVFLRYGRLHFLRIEFENRKHIRKQSNILLWKEFVQFFTTKKLIITGVVILLINLILPSIEFEVLLFLLLIFGNLLRMLILSYKKYGFFKRNSFLQIESLRGKYFGLFLGLWILFYHIKEFAVEHFSLNITYVETTLVTTVVIVILSVFNLHYNQMLIMKKRYI